jgi:nucleoside-diphosphate-sugar epimerase
LITITGASGFLGSELIARLDQRRMPARALARTAAGFTSAYVEPQLLPSEGLERVAACHITDSSAIIHAAARAHRMNESGPDALGAYRAVNVEGTRALIAAMAEAGVRRLVYVSSIKALGERSPQGPLKPRDPRHPEDPYGVSKAEAEDVVLEAHARGVIDAVIIRPVLVHGPGAKGNLDRLLLAVHRGMPLPLGSVHNRRSLVGVRNLADALLHAATVEVDLRALSTNVFHIADDGVVSTRRLVELMAEGMGRSPRLLPLPRAVAELGATLLGKRAVARRLFDDLEVDDTDLRRELHWKPLVSLEDGIREMARAYAASHR